MSAIHGAYRCANPTCSAVIWIEYIASHWDGIYLGDGWILEQHDEDDRPLPYCERCKL